MMTVMAANTNWKYTRVDIGNVNPGMPEAAAGTIAGPISKPAAVAGPGLPRNGNHCGPKAML